MSERLPGTTLSSKGSSPRPQEAFIKVNPDLQHYNDLGQTAVLGTEARALVGKFFKIFGKNSQN